MQSGIRRGDSTAPCSLGENKQVIVSAGNWSRKEGKRHRKHEECGAELHTVDLSSLHGTHLGASLWEMMLRF